DPGGIAVQDLHRALLRGAERAEPEADRQRALDMPVKNAELLDLSAVVRAGLARAVQCDAGMHRQRRAHLTDQSIVGFTVPVVPVIVRMTFLLPFADDQPVVNDAL